MILTPTCYYTDDPHETETTCGRCGRHIQYTHIVIADDGSEIGVGQECVKTMRRTGEITERAPRNGYYNWKMSDVRQAAYWAWYTSSLSRAD